MLTTVRQIGNSRGVLIPAAFLASCQIEDQIEMQMVEGKIIISPVQPAMRKGWFDVSHSASSVSTSQSSAEDAAWDRAELVQDSDWQW